MRILIGLAFSLSALLGTVQAATTTVTNGDFEAPFELTGGGALGLWELGASGWSATGSAGTWEFEQSLFTNPPAALGGRIGFMNAGSSFTQQLGGTIQSGTDYSLSALFGNRLDQSDFTGLFGFYAGDPTNIIGNLQAITDPGDGLFSLQTITVLATALGQYIDMQLGIIFVSESGQVTFDNVQVAAYYDDVIVTPLPAAIWLFGSALFAGGLASRRRKKTN